jgi:hypothetical protein
MMLAALALISTLVVGDSIAVGAGGALHATTYAHKGWSSCAIYAMLTTRQPTHVDRVVVSAGVNDPPGECVEAIFRDFAPFAGEIVVILPPPINSARAHIAAVAARYGAKTVSYIPGRDHLHPRSYPELARTIRSVW